MGFLFGNILGTILNYQRDSHVYSDWSLGIPNTASSSYNEKHVDTWEVMLRRACRHVPSRELLV